MIRLFLILSCLLASICGAQTTTSITQFGITWTFSEAREYGQFANGDYWVQGPVTITAMSPDWNGTTNGWMVDPLPTVASQGYHADQVNYNVSFRPALPLTLSQGSVVKVIGINPRETIAATKTAAVLTVLPDIPAGRGSGFFRPPYNGAAKPLNAVADVRYDLLPTFGMTASAPTLAAVAANFDGCLHLENNNSRNRMLRPRDVMGDYGPDNSKRANEAMLRLMGTEPWAEKLAAATYFLQFAIDKAYAVGLGFRSATGDGHDPNHRSVAAFGATLMDLTTIKTYMSTSTGFHEDKFIVPGVNGPLWGDSSTTEAQYWNFLMTGSGSKSVKDPYAFIDGGDGNLSTGSQYQYITSQGLKGSALVFRLFPGMQACIPETQWSRLDQYAARWVTVGRWYSPDPVAPEDIAANYRITFGPNGSGSYIAGSGRFIARHGTGADSGQNYSSFVASMWTTYADAAPTDTTAPTLLTAAVDAAGNNVTLTFTEPVQGIDLSHYVISGHSLSSLTGSGEVWAFTITPKRQQGPDFDLVYTGGAGRTADLAGNLLASGTFTVDNNSLEATPDPSQSPRRGPAAVKRKPIGL